MISFNLGEVKQLEDFIAYILFVDKVKIKDDGIKVVIETEVNDKTNSLLSEIKANMEEYDSTMVNKEKYATRQRELKIIIECMKAVIERCENAKQIVKKIYDKKEVIFNGEIFEWCAGMEKIVREKEILI